MAAYQGFSPYAQAYPPMVYLMTPLPLLPQPEPASQPNQNHPIMAMDALKARIMAAAPPGEVTRVIRSVQFVPRAAAFTSLIQMAAKAKQPGKAIEIFDSMSLVNMQPNTFSYSALISALARVGRWQDAERYFQELADKAQRDPEMAPNTITYAALISAYEKGGQLDKALAAFKRQLEAEVAPDLITYSSLITACERAGNLSKASELVDQLHASGLVGNHQLYHGMLSACAAAGHWELGLEVFLAMQCATLRPTAHTVGLLLDQLCDAGQANHALHLLREALRCRYDLPPSTYHNLLHMLAGMGQWQSALGVYQAMQLVKAGPDATSASLIVTACARGGQQALAAQLSAELAAQGLLQSPALPPVQGPTNGHHPKQDGSGSSNNAQQPPSPHPLSPMPLYQQSPYRRTASSNSCASTAGTSQCGGLGSSQSVASPRSSAAAWSPKA